MGGFGTIFAGADPSTASYGRSEAGVEVNLNAGTSHGGQAGSDHLVGIDSLVGGGFADLSTATSGGNLLAGGAGRDRLDGLGGPDVLDGGADGAKADGDAGDDVITLDLAPIEPDEGAHGDAKAGAGVPGAGDVAGSGNARTCLKLRFPQADKSGLQRECRGIDAASRNGPVALTTCMSTTHEIAPGVPWLAPVVPALRFSCRH